MTHWNWQITRDGVIRFSLILLTLSFSYHNLAWLNSLFLPQLPVGYILFGFAGIFTLRHIYRMLRWYSVWLNGKRYQKYEKLIMHICLYLVVVSVVLSVPVNVGDKNSLISDYRIFDDIDENMILESKDVTQENIVQEEYISPTRSNPKTYTTKNYGIIYFVYPYENQAKYQSVAELIFVNTNTTVADSQKITVNTIAAVDSYNSPIYGFDNLILPWSVSLKPYEKSHFPIYFRALDTTKPFTLTMSIESGEMKDIIDLQF